MKCDVCGREATGKFGFAHKQCAQMEGMLKDLKAMTEIVMDEYPSVDFRFQMARKISNKWFEGKL